jgi:hypothetical protein
VIEFFLRSLEEAADVPLHVDHLGMSRGRTLRCPLRDPISLAVEGTHLGLSAQVAGPASRRATPDVCGQYLSVVDEWQAPSVFPATAPDGRPAITTLAEWTFDEYGKLIAPRLRALGGREREPKVLPVVMAAWGIS